VDNVVPNQTRNKVYVPKTTNYTAIDDDIVEETEPVELSLADLGY
jgi:hypothetical protein